MISRSSWWMTASRLHQVLRELHQTLKPSLMLMLERACMSAVSESSITNETRQRLWSAPHWRSSRLMSASRRWQHQQQHHQYVERESEFEIFCSLPNGLNLSLVEILHQLHPREWSAQRTMMTKMPAVAMSAHQLIRTKPACLSRLESFPFIPILARTLVARMAITSSSRSWERTLTFWRIQLRHLPQPLQCNGRNIFEHQHWNRPFGDILNNKALRSVLQSDKVYFLLIDFWNCLLKNFCL